MRDEEYTIPGKMPVSPKNANVPVIATERWIKTTSNELRKCYTFKTFDEKKLFVSQILGYELQTQHPVKLTSHEDRVILVLQTQGVEDVTDIDKEFAKYADIVYKDIVYNR